MNWLFSVNWILVAGLWYLGNGILHDVFVLRNHTGPYNRELLRLLLDGHILILSGTLVLGCYWMLVNNIQAAYYITAIIGIGMLVYCALIFPFLKSIVTIIISLILVLVSILNGHVI